MTEHGEGGDLYLEGEERFGPVRSRLYALFSRRGLGRLHDRIASDVIDLQPSTILDLGCGPGDVLSRVASSGWKAELFGVDPSPQMLSIAKRRIGAIRREGVTLARGSSRNIPFPGTFDVILTSLSFHHWGDRERDLPMILQRLSNRGSLLIYEYSREALPAVMRLLTRSHALSEADVRGLEFPGLVREVTRWQRYVRVRFARREVT